MRLQKAELIRPQRCPLLGDWPSFLFLVTLCSPLFFFKLKDDNGDGDSDDDNDGDTCFC